jgi:hypothetical protein
MVTQFFEKITSFTLEKGRRIRRTEKRRKGEREKR